VPVQLIRIGSVGFRDRQIDVTVKSGL